MADKLWLVYSLIASVSWGITYSCTEKILAKGMPAAFLMAIESVLFFPFFIALAMWKRSVGDGVSLLSGDKTMWILVATVIVSSMTSSFLSLLSIQSKNATLTSMVELSYPVFIIFFTWLLFKEFHLNAYSAIGGFLVFCGVVLISVKG